METFLILSSCVLPCLVYVSAGVYLTVRLGRTATDNDNEETLHGLSKDLSAVLFIIAACYLTGCLQALLGASVEMEGVMDQTVLKLYVISSIIPFLLLRRCVYRDVTRMYLYLPAMFTVVLAIVSDVLIFTGYGNHSYALMSRGAVTLNMLVFLFCVIETSKCSRGMEMLDDYGRGLVKELQLHTAFLSLYNFIFLFYSFGVHPIIDYFILTAGFAIVHAVVTIAWSEGTWGASVLSGLTKRYFRSGAENEEYPARTDQMPALLEEDERPDYSRITRDEPSGLSLKERLLGYFECEKPYLSKNISMEEVAMRLYTNKSYLSKTINMEMNKNFRELVNYFRVKEAVRIFSLDMEISMNDLRDKCGFNNNASFTSAFKLNTGFTPGEWCRDMRNKRMQAMGKQR